jgi:electron-transferring-flavoprotein dehydrogenase
VNSLRLKGIHLAIKTGMLAAETAYGAIQAGDTSAARLRAYGDRIDDSAVKAELYPVRNVHQAFGHGLIPGLAFAGLTVVTGGRWPSRLHAEAGHERMRQLEAYYGDHRKWPLAASNGVKPDRVLTFDKLTNVHYSGTRHDEDQPVHLLVKTDVCYSRCGEEYGHPCTRFCPANVYEIVQEQGRTRLQINASNCVHCKTCDIMDPYQVITWVPPEGGGGPQYDGL